MGMFNAPEGIKAWRAPFRLHRERRTHWSGALAWATLGTGGVLRRQLRGSCRCGCAAARERGDAVLELFEVDKRGCDGGSFRLQLQHAQQPLEPLILPASILDLGTHPCCQLSLGSITAMSACASMASDAQGCLPCQSFNVDVI